MQFKKLLLLFFSAVATSEEPNGSQDKQAKLKQQMLNLEDKEN